MNDNDGCLTAFVFVAFCIGCAVLGTSIGMDEGTKAIKSEAVQRGFAEWAVDDQGNTEWKWKE